MSKKRLNHSILAFLCVVAVLFTIVLSSNVTHAEEASNDFNVYAYANRYVDLQQAFGGDIEAYEQHYKIYGIKEGRNGKPFPGNDPRNTRLTFVYINRVYNGIDYSAVFDPIYYIEVHGDIKNAYGYDQQAAFNHFIVYGMREGRQSIKGFNVYAYANRYVDLQQAFGRDLASYYGHYAQFGKNEGRSGAPFAGNDVRNSRLNFTYISLVRNGVDYSSGFDPIRYLGAYGDLRAAYGDDQQAAFEHFLTYGIYEGRSGNGSFNVYSYANRYMDLFNAFGTDVSSYFNHYSIYGRAEGRDATGCDTRFNVSNYITATDQGGGRYKITIVNPSSSAGAISNVAFPTWSEENGQDDIVWYQGTKNPDGSWSVIVDGSNHLSSGSFVTHVYATVNGNPVPLGGTSYVNNFDTAKFYGWVLRDGKYYFYDRTTGVMQRGGTACGVSLGVDGAAIMDDYAREKIPVMIRAREIVNEITNPNDSLAVKQEKCYQWVAKWPYMLKDYPVGNFVSGHFACVDAHYANNILNAYGNQSQPGAECVGEAAALAYLYAELNFGDVYLYSSNLHGWVYANGRYWDPLFVESRGRQYYNAATYEAAPTYKFKIN